MRVSRLLQVLARCTGYDGRPYMHVKGAVHLVTIAQLYGLQLGNFFRCTILHVQRVRQFVVLHSSGRKQHG